MKTKFAQLVFDDDEGVGIVKFSAGFATEHWVTQADALTDWIHALQEEYAKLLERGDT